MGLDALPISCWEMALGSPTSRSSWFVLVEHSCCLSAGQGKNPLFVSHSCMEQESGFFLLLGVVNVLS